MKRVIVVFLGIIMLLMFGCTKQVDAQADIQAIRQQGKGLVDAFNRADPDALAVFVTENVFVMPPNQQSVVGVEAVRAYWTEGFRVASSHLEISSEDLQVVGDWAIERFSWTVETQPAGGGARATDNGKGLWVWRRQSDGSWKLAQGINNSENPVPGTLWSGATGCMRANGQQKAGEDTSKGGFILQPEEGEVLRLGGPPGGQVIIKVDPAKTGSPQIAMGIQYVEGEIPVHQHEQEEEFLFVHRGRGVVVLGDERVSVQAGTTIYLPPGTWHGVQNTGDGALQVMWVVTPGTGASTQLEKFFRAAGAPPGTEVKSLKPEQFADIMEKHGMKAKP